MSARDQGQCWAEPCTTPPRCLWRPAHPEFGTTVRLCFPWLGAHQPEGKQSEQAKTHPHLVVSDFSAYFVFAHERAEIWRRKSSAFALFICAKKEAFCYCRVHTFFFCVNIYGRFSRCGAICAHDRLIDILPYGMTPVKTHMYAHIYAYIHEYTCDFVFYLS